ncbi:MAG: AMP-binding protein [Bacteriovoracaceae bacterium]
MSQEKQIEVICHERFRTLVPEVLKMLNPFNLNSHFVIFSSGTTSKFPKGYAISKEALKLNAQAVNTHFNLTSQDVWALSLPDYHIGGLSVLRRAQLLGNKVIRTSAWDPNQWHKLLDESNVTITTVVPTQVYDLVKLNLHSPSKLRYLVVGGDYLSPTLEVKAKALGWPVVRTFGMTEVCSQLAAQNSQGELEILPIHQVKIENERLKVKSPCLFTLQFTLKENPEIVWAKDLCDAEGFYPTQDRAELNGKFLKHLGRMDDQIKVNGRLISLIELKDLLSKYLLENNLYGQAELQIEADERGGKSLTLLHLNNLPPNLIEIFHPIKIQTRRVEQFDRTDLGKLRKTQ